MEAAFDDGASSGTDWFVFDTGSSAALHLDQAFASARGLDRLPQIGTSESRGVGPGVLKNRIVLLPKLVFGDHALANVPAHVEAPGQDRGLSTGCLLGMQVLGRFDTILDFPRRQVFLQPNTRLREPFETSSSGPSTTVVLVGVGTLVALSAAWWRARRAPRTA